MSNFLWHSVSEKEKEEISENAMKIMDNFSKKLEKVKGSIGEAGVDREIFERKEDVGEKLNIDREIMFENAPNKNKDFIVAEKRKW